MANFGVAVTGGSSQVQPRVVRAGDENRLQGELALPYNANPYLSGFGFPNRVAGAALPGAGDYDIVFDSASPSGAGPFTFRFWIADTTPPSAPAHLRSRRGPAHLGSRHGLGDRPRAGPASTSTAGAALQASTRLAGS